MTTPYLKYAQVSDDDVKKNEAVTYSREDYSAVNRFESHGGGWGYSGHSVEAIRFMADMDVLLGGFGLFGGRGEYLGKIKGAPACACVVTCQFVCVCVRVPARLLLFESCNILKFHYFRKNTSWNIV